MTGGPKLMLRSLAGAIALVGLGGFALADAPEPNYGSPLPDPGIPGYSFPENEAVVDGWVARSDFRAIFRHGWGLWAALTADSGTTVRGVDNAPVYFTWLSPSEIRDFQPSAEDRVAQAPQRLELRFPAQFARAMRNGGITLLEDGDACVSPVGDTCVSDTMAYSPGAARHAYRYQLFSKAQLSYWLDHDYQAIPDFPRDAVAVKPVYKTITQDKLIDGRYYKMPAWPGTPDPARAYPPQDWGQCIFVDIQNEGRGDGSVSTECASPTPETTYNLTDFIHFEVQGDDHVLESTASERTTLASGNFVILVGMHVTSKEITRWTWQTFWWTPSPDAPNAPSSGAIARQRPEQLTGPAAHYAMAIGYQMLDPAQPINGGENAGRLVPVYNPHLEAPFDTQVFSETQVVKTPDGPVTTDLGVQSNCMTCHGFANYTENGQGPGYASDFYVSRDDPAFDGTLQTDFLWSVPDTAQ